MRVDKITNTEFESKQRFITKDMRSSLESILLKMNSDISRVQEGDHFKTTINTKINYKDGKAVLEDERRLKEKVPFQQQMQGFSVLRIGKKIVLDIDNESGEIIEYTKPKFKPFFLVLKKAESILAAIRTNINLKEVVQKEYLTLNDLTPEGLKKVQRCVLNYEKERLQDVVKTLEETSK